MGKARCLRRFEAEKGKGSMLSSPRLWLSAFMAAICGGAIAGLSSIFGAPLWLAYTLAFGQGWLWGMWGTPKRV